MHRVIRQPNVLTLPDFKKKLIVIWYLSTHVCLTEQKMSVLPFRCAFSTERMLHSELSLSRKLRPIGTEQSLNQIDHVQVYVLVDNWFHISYVVDVLDVTWVHQTHLRMGQTLWACWRQGPWWTADLRPWISPVWAPGAVDLAWSGRRA